MGLERRLAILREGGLLSKENYQKVEEVIAFFKRQYDIELTEDNASGLITHLCSALERVSREEWIEHIDAEVYADAEKEPTFAKAKEIMEQIIGIIPMLSKNEQSFLIMHVGVLLAMIEEKTSTV